ncbi:MAG: type II toxin-antitoxin system VapC family toxin [Chlamydiales bacterium]|nr:type II toxin-antitoxin system VapC family toxin [Chlamydiales bacterium]
MYLLDTCVFSELIKKKPSPLVTEWIAERNEQLFSVSALTFGEIKKGIGLAQDQQLKKNLQMWLEDFIIPRFWSRIITIDGAVGLAWGELIAKQPKNGRVLPAIDSLIAASAIAHNLQIVTRNTKDFEGLNIPIVNPWILS